MPEHKQSRRLDFEFPARNIHKFVREIIEQDRAQLYEIHQILSFSSGDDRILAGEDTQTLADLRNIEALSSATHTHHDTVERGLVIEEMTTLLPQTQEEDRVQP